MHCPNQPLSNGLMRINKGFCCNFVTDVPDGKADISWARR
ncbi:hypothetical protein PTUN_b0314 [Pseudoalteromonas tunicata]|nr:hypothetical protein PTUN_b0314 [Pseudoalteromonas tunicata]